MNLPNLKDAKVRTKNQVNIKYGEYDIPENMENIGHGKYYYILTYGCQMNVHDSENISAIMEDMSYKKQMTWKMPMLSLLIHVPLEKMLIIKYQEC